VLRQSFPQCWIELAQAAEATLLAQQRREQIRLHPQPRRLQSTTSRHTSPRPGPAREITEAVYSLRIDRVPDGSGLTKLSNTAPVDVNWFGTARAARGLGNSSVISAHVRRSIQEGNVDAPG